MSERILFVAPSTVSTGEAATATAAAERLRAAGDAIHFLASPFITDRLPADIPSTRLDFSRSVNVAEWHATIAAFRPTIIWFADYEINFFQAGTSASMGSTEWLTTLDSLDCRLATFDHFGAINCSEIVYGRAPLTYSEFIPSPPSRMERFLPCPIHEPGPVEGRTGKPFRYSQMDDSDDELESIIDLGKDLAGYGTLISHFVPTWTERVARMIQHPYYADLSIWLQKVFAKLDADVTIVSVNESGLLAPSFTKNVKTLNLIAPNYQFCERLVRASDLVLSENAISMMIGKAIVAQRPAMLLRADHFDVFPIWDDDMMAQFNIYDANSYYGTLPSLDAMTDDAAEEIRDLLTDEDTIEIQREAQQEYIAKVDALPWIEEII